MGAAARAGHDPAHRWGGANPTRSRGQCRRKIPRGRRSARRGRRARPAHRTGRRCRSSLAADGPSVPRGRVGFAPDRRVAGRAARRSALMRGLVALLVIAAVVAIVGFAADNPGRVEITWQGWQIDTSAAVLAVMLIAALAVLSGLIALVGGLLRWPRHRRRRRAARRRVAGDAAVTRGLVALAAGDAVAAQHEAARAETLLDGSPVPLLLAARAQALLPDLAEPAAHHAQLLLALQRNRAAKRAIERAWRTTPHPDLARVYLDADHAEQPLAKAAALQRLAEQNPDAVESHLAVAEAALNAQLWGEARRHLGIAAAGAPPPGPTRRLCLMMARLEDSEPGAPQMARNWLERAAGAPPDPCYVCARCNAVNSEWQPVCGQCGGFDTFAWRVPQREADLPAPLPASAMPLLPAPEAASPGEAPRALARPRQSAK